MRHGGAHVAQRVGAARADDDRHQTVGLDPYGADAGAACEVGNVVRRGLRGVDGRERRAQHHHDLVGDSNKWADSGRPRNAAGIDEDVHPDSGQRGGEGRAVDAGRLRRGVNAGHQPALALKPDRVGPDRLARTDPAGGYMPAEHAAPQ